MFYGTHINVCKYENGIKINRNEQKKHKNHKEQDDDDMETIVNAEYVQREVENGATVQYLQPQQYNEKCRKIIQAIEQQIGCLVGSNGYVTPPKCQGLAPHYDDVEIFVLQLEGTKYWKLYHPLMNLAHEHSGDLQHSKIGKPFLEVRLEPGDLLYMPRGTIHEAIAEDTVSHHLTISTYQNFSYTELLRTAINMALDRAQALSLDFRHGLPIGFLENFGSVHLLKKDMDTVFGSKLSSTNDEHTAIREQLGQNVLKLMQNLVHFIDIDAAADELAVDYMMNRLPPLAQNNPVNQASSSAHQNVTMNSSVRFINSRSIRLVVGHDDAFEVESELEEDEDENIHDAEIDAKSVASTSMNGAVDDQREEFDFPTEQASTPKEMYEDEEGSNNAIFLLYSHNNVAEHHMDGRFTPSFEASRLSFPIEAAPILLHLLMQGHKFSNIEQLPWPDNGMYGFESIIHFIQKLVALNLVEVMCSTIPSKQLSSKGNQDKAAKRQKRS